MSHYVIVIDSQMDRMRIVKALIEVDDPIHQVWIYVPNDVVTPTDYQNWYNQCAEDFRANDYTGTAYAAT